MKNSISLETSPAPVAVSKKRTRRIALLKRTGFFSSDLKDSKIRRACTIDDYCEAYHLVHNSFVECGYIHSHPSGMRIRCFEALPEMVTYVARHANRVVGVQSLIEDTPELGLPSDITFHEEIDVLRKQGAKIYEATNQAVHPDYRKSAIPSEMIRLCIVHGLAERFDEIITTVSPGHANFFELIGFRRISEVRSYSNEINDPVIVLSLELDQFKKSPENMDEDSLFLYKFMIQDNPYANYVRSWSFLSRKLFLRSDLLREVFLVRSGFLADCSDQEREILLNRWGEELFGKVLNLEPVHT